MNQNILKYFLVALLFFAVSGCADSRPAAKSTTLNAKDAIKKSADLSSTEAQVQFLVNEAEGFLAEEKYQDAGLIAEHILGELDSSSSKAKKIQRGAYKQLQKSLVGG